MSKKRSKRTTKKNKTNKNENISIPVKSIVSIVLIFLSIFGLLELGLFGQIISSVTRVLFGNYPIIFFIFVIIVCVIYLVYQFNITFKPRFKIAFGLLFVAYELLLVILSNTQLIGFNVLTNFTQNLSLIFNRQIDAKGGFFGSLFYSLSSLLFDRLGSILLVILLVILGLIFINLDTFNEFQQNLWAKDKDIRKIIPKRDLEQKQKSVTKTKKSILKPSPTIHIDEPEEEPILPDLEEMHFEPIDMAQALKNEKKQKSVFVKADEEKEQTNDIAVTAAVSEPENVDYQLPSIDLLEENTNSGESQANSQSASAKGERLVYILKQFGINSNLIATHIGPAVTKFELKLDSSVKVSKIHSLTDNLMMELAVKDIRIEAPIPGRNAVGVEIPNIEMTPVRLHELLVDVPPQYENDKLLVALGKNLMGKNIFGRINRMPHVLVAGATGSGKSVCMNSMIASLLLRAKPNELKLVLVDPKKVEFQVFEGIPHLLAPVINDPAKATKALDVCVQIMENRYSLFMENNARNIESFNEIASHNPELKKMPHIVVIIDELADLMVVAGKEVEQSIQRLTQKARAAGIHLIVATQRPSVDVITGVIKSNIPSRIAFAVSSGTDSRTILDSTGAERLLGYGDMLYLPFGEPNATRIQGVFISDSEVKAVADAAKAQMSPRYDDAFLNLDGTNNSEGFVETSEDPMFEEVKEYVINEQKASTSLLQRRFGIGYNRAARMIDALEAAGIIGPVQGSKPRDVYVSPQPQVEDFE